MAQILKNNVSGVLGLALGAAETSMTLLDASSFPAPPEGDFYLLTLIGLNANGQEASWEIVKVTGKASNTLTVVRAQEGTPAAAWPVATTVQLRLTAGSVVTPDALGGKEASGTAATAMSVHTSAADPHGQYLPKADGAASGLTLNDGYTEEVFAVAGTTPALSPTNGSIQTWALTGNATPTLGTWGSGQSMTLLIDDGTAYSINWASTGIVWKTGGGTAPVLLTTGYTALALVNVGGTVYGWLAGDA